MRMVSSLLALTTPTNPPIPPPIVGPCDCGTTGVNGSGDLLLGSPVAATPVCATPVCATPVCEFGSPGFAVGSGAGVAAAGAAATGPLAGPVSPVGLSEPIGCPKVCAPGIPVLLESEVAMAFIRSSCDTTLKS